MSDDLNVLKGCSIEELRGYAEDMDGTWVAAAFVDRDNKRIIVAVSTGTDKDKTIQEAMQKAVERVEQAQAPSSSIN